MRARIAMPILAAGTGGDVYFRRLADALRRAGVSARVLALPWWYEFLPAIPAAVHRALRDYDLIHTNADWGIRFRVDGKPLLLSLHHCVARGDGRIRSGLGRRLYHRGLLEPRMRRGIETASAVFAPSRATCRAATEAFPSLGAKLRLIPHGLDAAVFCPAAGGARRPRTLLAVGSISPRKGSALFPALLDELGPEFLLHYVGRGDASVLRHPRIQWRPRVSAAELLEMYRSCAVFVSLSRLEGFGYAVAEAMACGAPVVVPASSSLPELVGESPQQLFAPENLEQCAGRVRALCGDARLSASLGEANRRRIRQRFAMGPMVDAYVDAYREAIDRAGRR